MAYAEGSRWNAYEGIDRCYVAGPHEIPLVTSQGSSTLDGDDLNPRHAADLAFDMAFGCQTVVTGLFKTQLADGIMGMSNQLSTYWGQMFKAGKMGSDRQFALCFSRPPNPTAEGTEAGALTLGGCDTRLHLSPMVFTPAASSGRASFFSVKIRRMMLRKGEFGESSLSNNNNPNKGVTVLNLSESVLNKGGIIVDSGTTDTYWNSGISTEFQNVFTELAGIPHSNKAMKLSDEEFKSLPTILFQLYSDDDANSHISDVFHTAGLAGSLDKEHKSDVILAIPPSHYMEYNPDSEKYTSRFYPTERSGSVLGANAMMGHDVLFDIDNNRIGWAESECDYTSTVKENGYEFDITGELKDVEKAGAGGGGGGGSSSKTDALTPTGCEALMSGAKCQKEEGCKWGFGKCTKDSSVPAAETSSPTSFPTDGPTQLGSEIDGETDTKEPANGEGAAAEIRNILEGNGAIAILVVFALSTLCCIYCLWCRRDNGGGAKYSRASLDPATIEMTNGNGNMMPIDNHIDSFSDEHEESNGSNGSIASGRSNTSSKFRDEPEFDGDFA